MSELETQNPTTGTLSERERRDAVRGQLRPLANRRPELYDEDEYTSADYERMMELYQGSMASIDEGVPAYTLTASLYERFSSRGEGEFAGRILSAMRKQFGGHDERPMT